MSKLSLKVNCGVIKNPTSKIVGMASIEIGGFLVLNNIKIVEGKDGYFLGMPSNKIKEEYKDVYYFTTKEVRDYVTAQVIKKFTDKLEKIEEVPIDDADVSF